VAKKRKSKGKPPTNPSGKGATTTRDEMRDRLDFVADLLAGPSTYGEVVDVVRDVYDVGERQAKDYIAKVFDRWDADAKPDRDRARDRQVRRILRMIGTWQGRNPHVAFRYEHLLARILGTLAPIRMIAVDEVDVGALTDEQLRRIAAGEDPSAVLGQQGPAIH
jgi:hypothetical protein